MYQYQLFTLYDYHNNFFVETSEYYPVFKVLNKKNALTLKVKMSVIVCITVLFAQLRFNSAEQFHIDVQNDSKCIKSLRLLTRYTKYDIRVISLLTKKQKKTAFKK